MDPQAHTIDQIREFNRFYTVLIGLLNTNYLSSGYSVTETRLLFEIYRQHQVSANSLIALLQLDKSYISRLLRGFETGGLIRRTPASEDGRRKIITLTESGQAETQRLIAITNQKITDLITPLSQQRREEVCDCMKKIIEIFNQPMEE